MHRILFAVICLSLVGESVVEARRVRPGVAAAKARGSAKKGGKGAKVLRAPKLAAKPNPRLGVRLFAAGKQQFKAKKFAAAIASYQAAFRADPKPLYLLGLAGTLEVLGRRAEALDAYRRYVAMVPVGKPREAAQSRVTALEGALAATTPSPPAVVAPVAAPSSEPAPVPVVVPTKAEEPPAPAPAIVGTKADEEPAPAPVAAVTAPASSESPTAPASLSQPITPPASSEAAHIDSPPKAVTNFSSPFAAAADTETGKPHRKHMYAGLGIGLAGVALAIVGGSAFGVAAANKTQQWNDGAQSGATWDPSIENDGARDAALAVNSIIIGSALAIGGGALALWAVLTDRKPSPGTTWRLAPSAGTNGAGILCVGRF